MDARERWQALQAQLTTARARLDAGDRIAALHAVDAALALDPDFLAARALRDRINAAAMPPPLVPPALAASLPPPEIDLPLQPLPVDAPKTVDPVAPAVPLVSAERYASFEQRAKRRRVDGRLDAARSAIGRKRIREAESALEEVLELDPNVPELSGLIAELDALRRGGPSFHGGRWLAAAAAFAIVVVGASSMQRAGGLVSRAAFVPPAPAAPEPAPAVAIDTTAPSAVATVGDSVARVEPPVRPPEPMPSLGDAARPLDARIPTGRMPESRTPDVRMPDERTADVRIPDVREAVARPPVDRPTPAVVAASAPASLSGVSGPIAPPVAPAFAAIASPPPPAAAPFAALVTPAPAPVAPPPAPMPAPSAPPAAAPVSSAVAAPNDETLVKQVLQRYRSAYEGLDARSARAVWPAVNESALARAFDGLESQSLTFDNCNVSLKGEAAAATCSGSARYVPKVGSHEPRVEPRTWNFTLRKNGPDWTIESARAQR